MPSPTAMPTISQPTPTLDLTIGWKTYIDTKFGYSIKYPSEWIFNTETRSFQEGDIFSVAIVGKDQKKDTEFYDGASLTIGEPIKTEKDVRTWVKEYYPANNLGDEPNIFSEETIASLSFQKFFTCDLGCFTYYNIKNNGYVYRIVIFAGGTDKINYEQTLSQILSNFKFLGTEGCIKEGNYVGVPEVLAGKDCCPGLVGITCFEPYPNGGCPMVGGNCGVCTKCGDKECGLGENKCNCPEDCK